MKETQTIYDSPKVKVVEIKTRKMLCASLVGEQGFGLTNDGQLSDGGDL